MRSFHVQTIFSVNSTLIEWRFVDILSGRLLSYRRNSTVRGVTNLSTGKFELLVHRTSPLDSLYIAKQVTQPSRERLLFPYFRVMLIETNRHREYQLRIVQYASFVNTVYIWKLICVSWEMNWHYRFFFHTKHFVNFMFLYRNSYFCGI